jgi:hypothetical protein
VLARLAEGCDDSPGLFFALLRTLDEARSEVSGHWPRGVVFARGSAAVAVYSPEGVEKSPWPEETVRTETWFRRHHHVGEVVIVDLKALNRPLHDLLATVPAPVRRAFTNIANLYTRAEQEAAATLAVVEAGRRLHEASRLADLSVGMDLEAALVARGEARAEMDRLYVAGSRLSRRRLLSLSRSAVVRL